MNPYQKFYDFIHNKNFDELPSILQDFLIKVDREDFVRLDLMPDSNFEWLTLYEQQKKYHYMINKNNKKTFFYHYNQINCRHCMGIIKDKRYKKYFVEWHHNLPFLYCDEYCNFLYQLLANEDSQNLNSNLPFVRLFNKFQNNIIHNQLDKIKGNNTNIKNKKLD